MTSEQLVLVFSLGLNILLIFGFFRLILIGIAYRDAIIRALKSLVKRADEQEEAIRALAKGLDAMNIVSGLFGSPFKTNTPEKTPPSKKSNIFKLVKDKDKDDNQTDK